MKIRIAYQLMLIGCVVLALYYQTVYAEVSLVDDYDMLVGMMNLDALSFKGVFFPQVESGGYYRPFIGLSYYLDSALWGLDSHGMHLDNILMHLINALLIFWLVRVALLDYEDHSLSYLPLIVAILFAVHPMATESVNWISGRTDLIAGNFLILSIILLLYFRLTQKLILLLLSFCMICFGLFAKEVSFAMFPAAVFILAAKRPENVYSIEKSVSKSKSSFSNILIFLACYSIVTIEVLYIGNYWFVIAGAFIYLLLQLTPWKGSIRASVCAITFNKKFVFIFSSSISVSIMCFIVLRRLVFRSDVGKIAQTIHLMLQDLNYSISLFLGASGFYLKKFFLPLPFNFYILEVNPLYDLLGIALLFFCLYIITRLDLAGGLFLVGVCMLLPALPFAFGTIAWTGYAERYLYLAGAFWTVSIALYLREVGIQNPAIKRVCRVLVPSTILFFGWLSFERTQIWQKNIFLLQDTVAQSPKVRVIREIYMGALHKIGNYEEAKKQYAIAQTLYARRYSEAPDLMMAGMLMAEGRDVDALKLYEDSVCRSRNLSERPIKATISQLERMLGIEPDAAVKNVLRIKHEKYESLLRSMATDPMLLYNIGQKALGTGDKDVALYYFDKANSAFPANNPYKVCASKLADKIRREKQLAP